MDIHDLVNIIDNVDWDERLPETREKVETCEYYNMLEYRDLLSNAHKTDFLLLHMNIRAPLKLHYLTTILSFITTIILAMDHHNIASR